MAVLTWDAPGERKFEAGIEKGVLYFPSWGGGPAPGVSWSGLTGIDDAPEGSSTPYFIDGVKYLDAELGNNYRGTLRAFTYPELFEVYNGIGQFDTGFLADDQPALPFHLSYQTRVGDDIDGVDSGYRIHILWNLLASPQTITHETLGDAITPVEFAWDLTACSSPVLGFRPTAHLILDPTEIHPETWAYFERALYGDETYDPSLPSLEEFIYAAAMGVVYDLGDGTWSITTPDENITMVSATEFEIEVDLATYLDADTYVLVNTNFN